MFRASVALWFLRIYCDRRPLDLLFLSTFIRDFCVVGGFEIV